MNLRIAYYVVALAISLAAFAGAYGYASPTAYAADISGAAAKTADTDAKTACNYAYYAAAKAADAKARDAYDAAFDAAKTAAVACAAAKTAAVDADTDADKANTKANAAFVTGYGVAGAVSLAAFAGAYILSKKAG